MGACHYPRLALGYAIIIMYFDLSVRKNLVLGVILCMLFMAVYITTSVKRDLFGATPYFYASTVGARHALLSLIADIQRASMTAFAALGWAKNAEGATPAGNAYAIPVLTYHRVVSDANDVNNVTVATFREQMQTLKDAGWQTVSLGDFEAFILGEKELPEKSFLITFDDGAKESYYPVDPILRAFDFEATIFVIDQAAERAGTRGSSYYLSPEELHRMLRSGRWSIGSHSYDGHHPYPVDDAGTTGIFFADRIWRADDLRLETEAEFEERVRNDLMLAKKELESEFGVPIRSFAFPLGNETGIEGANNYPRGSLETEEEASGIYIFGHLQHENQHYTSNFPRSILARAAEGYSTTTLGLLADDFLVRRVHVDHDWDGARLLEILENSREKHLPFEDDFSSNRGWIPAWGTLELGRNNLVLRATADRTSASTFLDGSALWDDYSYDIALNWRHGSVFVLADVVESLTYHACAFSPGVVRIESTVHGDTQLLTTVRDPRIAYGDVRLGIRVHDDVIECTWDFESIAEVYSRDSFGGIGIQTWDSSLGTASITVSSVIVRPFASTSAP